MQWGQTLTFDNLSGHSRRWLTWRKVVRHNPASELELPRPEKRLPSGALTLPEVDALLAIPDVTDPLGVRDRTMLEVFYSTGLRRLELCRLHLADFHAARRTLTVRRGKGHKDRVVPLGTRAIHWLERYLAEVRPRLCLDKRETALFLTGYGVEWQWGQIWIIDKWAWKTVRSLPHFRTSAHLTFAPRLGAGVSLSSLGPGTPSPPCCPTLALAPALRARRTLGAAVGTPCEFQPATESP